MDYLVKPVATVVLLESVSTALLESDELNAQANRAKAALDSIDSLTDREREVVSLLIKGLSNKEVARSLAISHRTVEIHKARIMRKTGAETLLDLARMAATVGLVL